MSTILMTGASRGIGLHAARTMLDERPDLRLIVVARGEQPELPRTTVVHGDLASLRSVRSIAEDINEPLDGFIGNAGADLKTGNTSTLDGYETMFAVHVLAQHLLLTHLPFTERARIVLTTSDSHFGRSRRTFGMVPPPQWSTPKHLARPGAISNGLTAYATSKLGVIYLVHAFARRTGLETYSFNPAFTPGTDLMRDNRASDTFFRKIGPRLPRVNTPKQAGAQLAAAAIGPRPAEPGAYIDRWNVAPSSPESYDEHREEELWSEAKRLTASAIT
ncbi:SDR family NAD(P)-dependent oxidoreductase [Micromonospora carbonacea]|uniref:SDR family NAD(P)-dependent oxidoreductase n=1 Tax=Micromonospora carbonacea TaxID=47853 RepID=UPI003D70BC87